MADSAVDAEPRVTVSRNIASAAMLIMVGNLFSRVLGLVREQLAAGLFGTGDRIAAFQIADNVHTLLFDLAISGMLQAALIPVLVQWSAPDAASRAELRRVAGALLTLVLLVVGSAVVIGMLFAPAVVDLMTALGGQGDDRSGETRQLTIDLVRIILPAVFFLAIGTLFMGVLYALDRVTMPALALAARNAAVVVIMIAFSPALGVRSMAIGVVVGAVLIAAMQVIPLRRAGALPKPTLALRHPGVGQTLRLYLPIFLGLVISAVAVIVDRNLAWRAEADALGAMRYATTLVQFVLGVVAAAIALAALPTLAAHHTAGDAASFARTLDRALAMVTVLIVPAVLGLAAVSVPAVDLLFRHGATGDDDARLIVIALLGYLPGTLFAAYDQVLIYAFYARQNTIAPVLVGVAATGVYFAIALTLANSLGMLGLVLANSAQFVAHATIMVVLARRVFGIAGWQRVRYAIERCAVAGLVMAAATVIVWAMLDWMVPASSSAISTLVWELVLLALPALVGGALYLALLHRFGVPEIADLRRAIVAKLPGRFASWS